MKKFRVRVCARMMLFTAYEGTSKRAAQAHYDTAKNALVIGRGTGTVNIHETISPIETPRNGLLIPEPKLIGAVNVIEGAFNDETF